MNLNEIYTQLILEHSKNKRNKRNLENATYTELGHNPSCGDEITLQVKVVDGIIEDLSYTGQGCAISQASTSIMIDTVKGLSLEKAYHLCESFISMVKGQLEDSQDIDDLGDAIAFENIKNLPARVKCAVLAWYTLKDIIEKDKTQESFNI